MAGGMLRTEVSVNDEDATEIVGEVDEALLLHDIEDGHGAADAVHGEREWRRTLCRPIYSEWRRDSPWAPATMGRASQCGTPVLGLRKGL